MKTVDWTARADQVDQTVVQHIQASIGTSSALIPLLV